MERTKRKKKWSVKDADQLYSIGRWGGGYFGVNNKGHLCVYPNRKATGPTIDMMEVIEEIKQQNISFPSVIRFHDILRSQVKLINKTFRDVIEEASFRGQYMGVYPIKVNQMREVVEEIVDAGSTYNFGLEAGSKAELISVLALNENHQSLTVLNGYKDEEYLKLAMLGRKLGRKIIVVIEQFSELKTLIKISKEMKVEPLIGVRAKLSVKGAGKWADSGGEHAKFGLTISEILKIVQILKEEDLMSSLVLFHFHIGSQVTDIRTIKEAITEGGRIYAKLCQLGVPLEFFDVGGGLGVDYDGTRSTAESSMNYSMKEYAQDIVYNLKQICDVEEVEHPNIVSESGRAITAIHSCVVTNVYDKVEISYTDYPTSKKAGEHLLVSNMRELTKDLNVHNVLQIAQDAQNVKAEALNAFRLGVIGLEERAKIETLYWEIFKDIQKYLKKSDSIPDDLKNIDDLLATQYLCNFSIFQSAPDAWAIGQLLPIVPINRLNEEPTEICSLVDITCDSDGKVKQYIGEDCAKSTIPMHKLKESEDYYVGVFMTGAYQDVMGDNHNLFGRLNEVHVFCDDDDPTDFYIEEVIPGTSAETVLASMQYSPQALASTIKKEIDKQIKRGKISPREGVRLCDFYEGCLRGYTYLK
jgi:arginine decarboxylase